MKRLRRWRRRLLAFLAGALLPPLLALWRRLVRVRFVGDPRAALRAQNVLYIFALHHAQQLGALLAHDEPAPLALVSASRDGELLARVLARLGVRCVRGSRRDGARNKGGGKALRALVERLAAENPAIIAVDGPRGPAGVVRRGALALAAQTGAAVLPVAIAAARSTTLHRTWDGTELPWPLQRLTVTFGVPIRPPLFADEAAQRAWVETQRVVLEETLWHLRVIPPSPPTQAAPPPPPRPRPR